MQVHELEVLEFCSFPGQRRYIQGPVRQGGFLCQPLVNGAVEQLQSEEIFAERTKICRKYLTEGGKFLYDNVFVFARKHANTNLIHPGGQGGNGITAKLLRPLWRVGMIRYHPIRPIGRAGKAVSVGMTICLSGDWKNVFLHASFGRSCPRCPKSYRRQRRTNSRSDPS